MSTVIVTIATSVNQYPAGTVGGGIVITIPGIAPQTITSAPYAATFDNVGPGTYSATAQLIDATGNPLGAIVTSASFDVVAPATVGIDTPMSITIAIQ